MRSGREHGERNWSEKVKRVDQKNETKWIEKVE